MFCGEMFGIRRQLFTECFLVLQDYRSNCNCLPQYSLHAKTSPTTKFQRYCHIIILILTVKNQHCGRVEKCLSHTATFLSVLLSLSFCCFHLWFVWNNSLLKIPMILKKLRLFEVKVTNLQYYEK